MFIFIYFVTDEKFFMLKLPGRGIRIVIQIPLNPFHIMDI